MTAFKESNFATNIISESISLCDLNTIAALIFFIQSLCIESMYFMLVGLFRISVWFLKLVVRFALR